VRRQVAQKADQHVDKDDQEHDEADIEPERPPVLDYVGR
jgi:hypothetical protein